MSATRITTARWLLIAVSVGIAAALLATPTQAQVGGFDKLLVLPRNVVIEPLMTPLRLARMLEVPRPTIKLGAPAVKFSYGEFLLLKREETPPENRPGSDRVASTPSDQGHASTNPVNLNWDDFNHVRYLMTPVKDQAERGTCWAQAATGLVEGLLKLRSYQGYQHITVDGEARNIVQEIDLSEQWLVWRNKKDSCAPTNASCGDGGGCLGALQTVQTYGHVPETFWRYNPQHWENDPAHRDPAHPDGPWNWKLVAQCGNDGNAPRVCDVAIANRHREPVALENFKVRNVVNGGGRDGGVTFIKNKIDAGLPVAVSVPWPTWRMIGNGCVLYVPDAVKDRSEDWCWNDTENVGGRMVSKWFRGGHCLVIVGYGKPGTSADGLFAFKNSWSRWWGKDGYGFFTDAFLRKFLWDSPFADLDST